MSLLVLGKLTSNSILETIKIFLFIIHYFIEVHNKKYAKQPESKTPCNYHAVFQPKYKNKLKTISVLPHCLTCASSEIY